MENTRRFIDEGAALLEAFVAAPKSGDGRAFVNFLFDVQDLLREHRDVCGALVDGSVGRDLDALLQRAGALQLRRLGVGGDVAQRIMESGDDDPEKGFLDWAKERVEQGRQDVTDADGPIEKAEAVWDTVRDIADEGMDRLGF